MVDVSNIPREVCLVTMPEVISYPNSICYRACKNQPSERKLRNNEYLQF